MNDGSPSGFSFVNSPASGFRASDSVDHFDLPTFDCARSGAISAGGSPTLHTGELPVHPEMADAFAAMLGDAPFRQLTATATSSGRTLSVRADGTFFFAKVAYQRRLGRLTRKMKRAHVLSAIEVSATYEDAISKGRMPQTFHIYREHSGLYFPDANPLSDWGYVERAINPFPDGQFIQIPAFSLFAIPCGGRPTLLNELLDAVSELRTVDGFFMHLIQPLLDLYFSSVIILGLQPEAHAQNVVFLLDKDYMPVGTALRDMESVDKDLPLLEALGLDRRFTRTGYKFLTKDAYNYQIMHSFMYDFKLGEYLIRPLIGQWQNYHGNVNQRELDERTREYALSQLSDLPGGFFPKGVWYDYEAIVHEGTASRDYRKHLNPLFR